MSTETQQAVPVWWRAHDVVVGILSGFGVGAVAGLFANRLVENNVVVLIAAAVGAVLGVYVLIQNHQRAGQFVTGVVVVTWVLLVASGLFLAAFIWAVLNFN